MSWQEISLVAMMIAFGALILWVYLPANRKRLEDHRDLVDWNEEETRHE